MLLTTVASAGSVESSDCNASTIGDDAGCALRRRGGSEANEATNKKARTITPAREARCKVFRFRFLKTWRMYRLAAAAPQPAAMNRMNAPGRMKATSVNT